MTRIDEPMDPIAPNSGGRRLFDDDDDFVQQQRKRLCAPDSIAQDAARAKLWAYYYEPALAYATVLLKDTDATTRDANAVVDYVDSAFVRVFHAYEPSKQFGRYLGTALKNARKDVARRLRRLREVPLEDDHFELPDGELAVVDALIRRTDVSDAIRKLHPELREAVWMRFIQEMTYQQMADVLGIAMTTARSRAHRALRQLRELLENYEIQGDHNVE